MRKNLIIVILAVLTFVGFGLGGAEAAGLIGSHGIRDNSIRSVDVHNGSLRVKDLSSGARSYLKGQKGADGAPGLSNIQAGADYTHVWKGTAPDGTVGGLQTIVAACKDGQYAISGGYSTWGGDKYDLGGDNNLIQITVSAPATENYVPISDTNSNFRPTEWVVKGYNHGDKDQIVRAWVVCADAN